MSPITVRQAGEASLHPSSLPAALGSCHLTVGGLHPDTWVFFWMETRFALACGALAATTPGMDLEGSLPAISRHIGLPHYAHCVYGPNVEALAQLLLSTSGG